MELLSFEIVHPGLGRLSPNLQVSSGTTAFVFRVYDTKGNSYIAKIGRKTGQLAPGGVGAYGFQPSEGPRIYRRSLTRAIIDGALIAEALHLRKYGDSYRVRCHGLGYWLDPQLGKRRPALITDEITGQDLDQLDREEWRKEAWQIVSQLLGMLMITPRGENAPHRDIKPSNILISKDKKAHLLDPGVEIVRTQVEEVGVFDLQDSIEDEPWPVDEVVALTTFTYYPTFSPGIPGADLQAMGLMIYEGITGQRPLNRVSPAPRSYNFGNGFYGRGVASPNMIIGDIKPAGEVYTKITRQMETLIDRLLHAPCDHDLALGQGLNLDEWTSLCHKAAASMRY